MTNLKMCVNVGVNTDNKDKLCVFSHVLNSAIRRALTQDSIFFEEIHKNDLMLVGFSIETEPSLEKDVIRELNTICNDVTELDADFEEFVKELEWKLSQFKFEIGVFKDRSDKIAAACARMAFKHLSDRTLCDRFELCNSDIEGDGE